MQKNTLFILVGVLAFIALSVGIISDALRPEAQRGEAANAEADARQALTPVVFATDWKAQAEHGGFYQALANGYYADLGLGVEIRMGGPGVNVPQLLAAEAVEFGMGSNQFIAMNLAASEVPATAVAAIFQKDPQVLITHPRDDINSIEDMAGHPIMIADATVGAFWVWLKAKFGFADEDIRKYTFNLAPFLADEEAIQQGYISSEPYTIEQEGGIEPEVYLLADAGYPGYANFILVQNKFLAEQPDLVSAFVAASIAGWRSYLLDDPAPANALIKANNPEMTDALLAHAREVMRANHIVIPDGGTAEDIGTMTDARWQAFFETMSAEGLYDPELDYGAAYTLDFLPSTSDSE